MADEVSRYAPDSGEDEDGLHEAAWTEAAAPESPAESWWSRLIAFLGGGGRPDEKRLARLNQAIARQPMAAANYVLRGELYLQAGEAVLAAADFKTALDLASDQFDREDWGILSQVMRDQAERGLELANRRLHKQ